MTFGMKRLFADEEEVKAILSPKPNKEPMSKHMGANHKIIKNSAGGKDFLVCQPCCMEVYDDDDDCGAVMF